MSVKLYIPAGSGLTAVYCADGTKVAVASDGTVTVPDGSVAYLLNAGFQMAVNVGGLVDKGAIDCSGNPNYPAATLGDVYHVSAAGKIGGASGDVVEIGDMVKCHTTGAAGTKAAVGGNWTILQKNLTPSVDFAPWAGSRRVIGSLIGANMNATTDQAIAINAAKYVVRGIVVTNASISLDTAVGGVYPTTSKGGTAIVANTQAYSALTAASKFADLTLAGETDTRTLANLYLSLTTAQGAAATADVYVIGDVIA